MSQKMINQMIAAVDEGYTPRSVWETSLTFAPGSSVKVNKPTTGTDPDTGATFTIPEGEVVSIIGVGGGNSGADHHVLLKDGRQAVVPFYDLGEAILCQESTSVNEGLTGVVVKVTLTKPLPQSAIDWLGGGYYDYGVSLPNKPQSDSASTTTFLMKSMDQEKLDSAIEVLKKVAGASYKSDAPSNLTDWAEAY